MSSVDGPETDSYWYLSRLPLQILVFLLPLVVVYEVALAWTLRSEEGVLTNRAHETLLTVFETLGLPAAGGLYLGGVVIIVVLAVWHLLNRDPWYVDGQTILGMAGESALLTIPLLVVGLLVQRGLPAWSPSPEATLAGLSLWPRLMISIGAGLYEELLFRMLLIAVIHTLLVDLARLPHVTGAAIAVVISAVAFAWYHPLAGPDGQLAWSRLVFFLLAGLYFGLIFLVRGFGIVVGVHALYDIVTVTLLSEA